MIPYKSGKQHTLSHSLRVASVALDPWPEEAQVLEAYWEQSRKSDSDVGYCWARAQRPPESQMIEGQPADSTRKVPRWHHLSQVVGLSHRPADVWFEWPASPQSQRQRTMKRRASAENWTVLHQASSWTISWCTPRRGRLESDRKSEHAVVLEGRQLRRSIKQQMRPKRLNHQLSLHNNIADTKYNHQETVGSRP